MVDSFFDETSEQSQIKSTIVSKYFWAWASIIKRHSDKIAYLDLFAGPGRYKDGTSSTPLLILSQAIQDADLSQKLITVFNDKDEANCNALETAIKNLGGIENLKYKPQVLNKEVGTEMVKEFEQMKLVPTLFFVDPWGYKGLSLQLVNAVVKDWACECIFFFNYNRINMGLNNQYVEEHMNALFGEENADVLRNKLEQFSPADRELEILEQLCESMNPNGGRFVLPFRFINEKCSRTSHHLIFVSKNFLGYDIMKHVMYKESTKKDQNVGSFEYNPADKRFPTLFELSRPLDDLEDMLTKDFSGRTITFKNLYETHSVGKPYIDSNYKQVLKKLEEQNHITATKTNKTRRKGTFADDVLITFSQGEN